MLDGRRLAGRVGRDVHRGEVVLTLASDLPLLALRHRLRGVGLGAVADRGSLARQVLGRGPGVRRDDIRQTLVRVVWVRLCLRLRVSAFFTLRVRRGEVAAVVVVVVVVLLQIADGVVVDVV